MQNKPLVCSIGCPCSNWLFHFSILHFIIASLKSKPTCKVIKRMPGSHHFSPVENKNDMELDFKVFFFTDSCCSDIVHDESN